ncbi:uncharacterized protein MAM_06618 [Metarhizium album ARSEF 1941]|uniref:Uncharacterized protein n=1 Tax=Metarhizium album (strain ARSEF 1941) TaxID=1081103 RepID=A0A0B2WHQ9_METAS|nr:uncharacterized protein MAM_06618 [Metarhizium album ARSEF 1941]KHN95561.1 hypothetical protein MAM_06618 [Metarhizium album ARSEF 1941]
MSLPYFVCIQWGIDCQNNCPTNACKSDCVQKNPCGAQDPPKPNASKTADAKPTSSSGSNTIFSDAPGGGSAGGKNGAGAALEVGRTYGLAIVLTGLFAGFAFL